MFYSQFILAKKGPLGTIWIAAHLERKLRKNQVADTDIGVSVDSILFPEVPIALRLSSHLLLGVVRIYSRKVNYLFHDCSEALLKVKQAFRSTAVDLPPEESTAPYHSITLPETFDLDDFELPDGEFFQGNYVDHHVSTREQITLQDTMDGVVYSTSQFGLDERFGDGDTSQIGLDLDEDLFLDKVTKSGHAAVLLDLDDVDPQSYGQPMTPYVEMDIDEDQNKSGEDRTDETSEIMPADASAEQIDSNTQDPKIANDSDTLHGSQIHAQDLSEDGFPCEHIEGSSADPFTDLVECAQVPSTPGLADEAMRGNVQDPGLTAEENLGNPSSKADIHIRDTINAVDSSLFNDETDVLCMPNGENGSLSGSLPVIQVKQRGDSPSTAVAMDPIPSDVSRSVASPTSVLAEQPKPISPESECIDRTSAAPDSLERAKTSQNNTVASTLEETCSKSLSLPGVESVSANSKLASDCQVVSESDFVSHKGISEPQAFENVSLTEDVHKSCSPSHALPSSADSLLGQEGTHELDNVEAKACLEPEGTKILNPASPDENPSTSSHVLRACSSLLKQPNVSSFRDEDLVENAPDLSSRGTEPFSSETSGREAVASGTSAEVQGEECHPTNAAALEENKILESFPSDDAQADLSKSDKRLNTVISKDAQLETLNCSASSDLPAPEILLSAPAGVPGVPSDLLVESPQEKEDPTECEGNGDGIQILTGKKRRLMESTPVLLDGNSAKLPGVPRSKRTRESIPDDDDLLSSILVGRRSSVLKLRPSPPPPEVASSKRPRVTPRVSVPKRKVLLDDTMVLHGDTIRQQLTSTEDIRRIRKKAPCTRPEIWMIQKHLLEDEIFSEPLFSGMSEDLIDLHNQTYDLIEARVSEIDANHVPLEVTNEKEISASTDLIGETSVEGTGDPVVIGHDGEAHEPAKTLKLTENQLPEKHSMNSIGCDAQEQQEPLTDVPPLDLPKDGQLGDVSSMDIDKQDNGVADIADHPATVGAELPLPTGSPFGDNCNVSVGPMIESSLMDESNGAETSLKNDESSLLPDQKLVIQSVENDAFIVDTTNYKGHDATDAAEVNGEGLILAEGVSTAKDGSFIQETEGGSSIDDLVESSSTPITVPMFDNCSVETGADVLADAFTPLENVNPSFTNVSGGSGGPTDPDVVNNDHVSDGVGNSSSKLIYSEESQRDSSCPLEPNADFGNIPFDQGENPGCQESNLGWSINGESTALDNASVRESGDYGNTIDGNDTEFLNVDDEEVDDEEEDNTMPNAEEARFLENSGWSSRTRAVARYLQTLFDNESGHVRKALPMDNLLSGKTRKEASRMFFETLVLKTRDYIHVEQENPFDNINIKPRVKLMKSDF